VLHNHSLHSMTSPFSRAVALWGHLPQVIGVDIGHINSLNADQPLGLRVHVTTPGEASQLTRGGLIPDFLDGVPVAILPSQYAIVASRDRSYSATAKYSVRAIGLGQLLGNMMAKQHPMTGRCHRIIATSANGGNVLAPCVPAAAGEILRALGDLEQQVLARPDTPASILCYQTGQLAETGCVELYVKNLPATKSAQKFAVDGVGLYAHETTKARRFTEGFRLLPG